MTKEYKSLLYVLKHLSFNKMAKFISFFILVLLLLLSAAESSRSLSANTHKVSSPEESDISDDGCCSGLESEECLTRRFMAEHTDYIYTQDITGP
ncbi:phytosulfokines [Manihot esculenta]|uniref:Phytosulfokine n=1 Tax=Manihot esculenta TaxID=3983 RepID=A0A2C9UK70_MANES|nr:phytosulfokines [Manihot esculenta]OAY31206.1 hypothetical protein MANES_14G092700v8 [Manihot esculenta]